MMRFLVPLGIVVAFAAVSVGWWIMGWLDSKRASDFDDKHTTEREEDQ